MTDNEIIKALEKFHHRILKTNLSYHIFESEMMAVINALDLINRQKAEIEQWKEEANKYQTMWCEAVEDIQIAKSEAIKEFAERLKSKMLAISKTTSGYCRYIVEDIEIDNLVKELEGELKNETV